MWPYAVEINWTLKSQLFFSLFAVLSTIINLIFFFYCVSNNKCQNGVLQMLFFVVVLWGFLFVFCSCLVVCFLLLLFWWGGGGGGGAGGLSTGQSQESLVTDWITVMHPEGRVLSPGPKILGPPFTFDTQQQTYPLLKIAPHSPIG